MFFSFVFQIKAGILIYRLEKNIYLFPKSIVDEDFEIDFFFEEKISWKDLSVDQSNQLHFSKLTLKVKIIFESSPDYFFNALTN